MVRLVFSRTDHEPRIAHLRLGFGGRAKRLGRCPLATNERCLALPRRRGLARPRHRPRPPRTCRRAWSRARAQARHPPRWGAVVRARSRGSPMSSAISRLLEPKPSRGHRPHSEPCVPAPAAAVRARPLLAPNGDPGVNASTRDPSNGRLYSPLVDDDYAKPTRSAGGVRRARCRACSSRGSTRLDTGFRRRLEMSDSLPPPRADRPAAVAAAFAPLRAAPSESVRGAARARARAPWRGVAARAAVRRRVRALMYASVAVELAGVARVKAHRHAGGAAAADRRTGRVRGQRAAPPQPAAARARTRCTGSLAGVRLRTSVMVAIFGKTLRLGASARSRRAGSSTRWRPTRALPLPHAAAADALDRAAYLALVLLYLWKLLEPTRSRASASSRCARPSSRASAPRRRAAGAQVGVADARLQSSASRRGRQGRQDRLLGARAGRAVAGARERELRPLPRSLLRMLPSSRRPAAGAARDARAVAAPPRGRGAAARDDFTAVALVNLLQGPLGGVAEGLASVAGARHPRPPTALLLMEERDGLDGGDDGDGAAAAAAPPRRATRTRAGRRPRARARRARRLDVGARRRRHAARARRRGRAATCRRRRRARERQDVADPLCSARCCPRRRARRPRSTGASRTSARARSSRTARCARTLNSTRRRRGHAATINASALGPDLNALPAGDATETASAAST